jgi:hypothetical protein
MPKCPYCLDNKSVRRIAPSTKGNSSSLPFPYTLSGVTAVTLAFSGFRENEDIGQKAHRTSTRAIASFRTFRALSPSEPPPVDCTEGL